MATATTSIFKPSPAPVSDSSSLLSLTSLLSNPSKAPCLSIPPRQIKLHLSQYLPLKPRKQFPSFLAFAAQTSEWAQNEEDSSTITFHGQETRSELEEDQSTRENQDSDGAEAELSNWEGEGQDVAAEESEAGGEFGGLYEEPSEDAKLFVGNLPYDVDSQTLAMHFEKAGTVEIAEVIYNRETDQSRGFGFVTMSSVDEADKAAEMLNRYVRSMWIYPTVGLDDGKWPPSFHYSPSLGVLMKYAALGKKELNGRLLTVNKAAPRGSRPERPARVYEPSFRIYVGNLPWDVDNARLEQLFSGHGKVVDARIVSDWETGRSRGFGFVTMSSETELNDAIAALDGQNVDGRTIRVNVAEERPRRSF